MISLRFPDDSVREFEPGTTGLAVAEALSKSLAKKAMAVSLDGRLADLSEPIGADAAIEIVARDDPRALELIRHDCAHVLAEAVQEIWPDTKVSIGPVIANGFYYDFDREEPFTPQDLAVIEKKMREIIRRNRPFTREEWSREDARRFFEAAGEPYKVELVDLIPEGEALSIYRQGEWLDLCRGPHGPSTGKVGEAFKLMSTAGAYWRGDADNRMMTRIYGTAWADQKDLKAHLHRLEEAAKRDHRKLGREMNLFHFQEEAPGTVFWHPKGWTLFNVLVDYVRRINEANGYREVNGPELMDRSLWEASGHWEKFHENMFVSETEDERTFALKPMNCPGHVQIYKHGLTSYRDLPVRIAEFGKVHRYEPSGALHGLMRVRGFTQDDAHVFCTREQIRSESIAIHETIMSIYRDFGFDEVLVKLSTRPEQRVGDDALWDLAEEVMGTLLDEIARDDPKITTGVLPGEGAFYGPKYEYTLTDAIGREWQVGTNQVDFNMPGRLGAFYVDAESSKQTPVMLHRAMLGSLERFIGILIENFAGHFPLWLAPVQAVVATITSDADGYAADVARRMREAGLRVEVDTRNEKINYKVREHSLQKVPVIVVCGAREADEGTVNIRRLGSREQLSSTLGDAVAALTDEALPPDIRRRRDAARERAAT